MELNSEKRGDRQVLEQTSNPDVDSAAGSEARPPWYALQLKPNGLDIAIPNLKRQGYEVLMPRQEVSLRTKRGLRRVRRPLFPGYLFVSAPDTPLNWSGLNSTRGVIRVVMPDGRTPAVLPTGFIAEMRVATDADGTLKVLPDLCPGDRVRLLSGPLTGWLAEVLAADEGARLSLLVEMMGRSVRVALDSKDVEKLC